MQGSRQLRIAFGLGAGLIGVLGLVGGSEGALAGLVLWLLVLTALWVWTAVELRRLITRTAGMPQRAILRNELGFPLRVRAEVAGRPVTVSGAGVEVRLDNPTPADVTHDPHTLRALSKASVPISAAAGVLSAAGVRALVVHDGRLRLRGGRGPIQPLVEAALALVGAGGGLRLQPTSAGACPYCHQPASFREEAVRRCAACDALHHAACWSEHGGCAVFGCEHAPRERARPAPDAKGHA